MTNVNYITVGILILLVGLGVGYVIGGKKADVESRVMTNGREMSDSDMSMGNAMTDMMQGLQGKTGDEFDKAFLSEMIVHHQGAVSMAEAALSSANHAEIKQMAQAIISAQSKEIDQMKGWQKTWYNQ